MMKFLLVTILLTAAFVALSRGTIAVQCPEHERGASVVPCSDDCVAQHGRTGGNCVGNDCKCTGNLRTNATTSAQCQDDSNFYAELLFDLVCKLDCKCFHGATGGTCLYNIKACDCGPDSTEGSCTLTDKTTLADLLDLLPGIEG